MDDEMPPRLPPRYSSLPRRSKDKAALNEWYNQSEPGPSFNGVPSVPQPFTRDYAYQSSTRSTSNPPYSTNNRQSNHLESDRHMGNGYSSQVREAGADQPRDWLQGPPNQQQLQHQRKGSVRPLPSANRRTELERAAEHSVLPEGTRVSEPKRKKTLRRRFTSYLSFTITAIVETLNGTRKENNRERKERKAQQRSPPKRTQSLTRIDTREFEEGSHRRTQSVRAPPRRREDEEELIMAYRRRNTNSTLPNRRYGLENTGNSCYIASAVQALRPVVTRILLQGDLLIGENDQIVTIIKNLFVTLEKGTPEEIDFEWRCFSANFATNFRSGLFKAGDQDDASLALMAILDKLHDFTKRALVPPTAQQLRGLSEQDRHCLVNRADAHSSFYYNNVSITQTLNVCLNCHDSIYKFNDEIMAPTVIPERSMIDTMPPLKVSFVRSVAGRCQNFRAHLNRYLYNIVPSVCQLKDQMYDHELIHPFQLSMTEVFVHGREGWELLGELDSNRVGSIQGYNEFLTAIEFPADIENNLLVLVSFGGALTLNTTPAIPDGPLFFILNMNATVDDLRKAIHNYLGVNHPFVNVDFVINREQDPRTRYTGSIDTHILSSGVICNYEVVQHNIKVHKSFFPNLSQFIRISCQYDPSILNSISIHRSAAKPKWARKFIMKMDVPFLLKSGSQSIGCTGWTCSNGHSDKSVQVSSFCNLADFISISIKRVDVNANLNNPSRGKIHEDVIVPMYIDFAPLYRKEYPKEHGFVTPRTHRRRMIYELVSTMSHEGGYADVGHYTTIVRDPSSSTGFFKYNDSMVREAPMECLHKNPALVIYRRKPTADFSDVKYDIATFARGAEEAPRPAEYVFDDPLAASMTRVQFRQSRGKGKVQFDRNSEPRYHPDRPPADLKGSKRKKAKK